MSNFYKLALPEGDGFKWFVLTELSKNSGHSYWLRNDGVISNNVQNADDFYYDTELDAFYAIKKYYDDNGKDYPYHSQQIRLMIDVAAKDGFAEDDLTGSRELELEP